MALENTKQLKITYYPSNPYRIEIGDLDSSLQPMIVESIVIDKAYIKIISIEGNKEQLKMCLGTYKTSNKEQLITTEYISFKPNVTHAGDNFIKQGYDYLKTLPEYAGAVDILEEGQML